MADVPEHLLKRAEEAKAKALAKKAAAAGNPAPAAETPAPAADAEAAASYAEAESTGKIPAHLLARSAAAKAAKAAGASGGGDAPAAGGGVAVLDKPGSGAAAAAAILDVPGGTGLVGPAGHTQRLLTVVKAGSIQDVKAVPTDKVSTWPHLLIGEFAASLLCLLLLTVLSAVVNAPLLALANYNQTPNPSKAPWYFLGLQELLTMFHPMVAGVTIPGMGLFILILAPYIDKNPSNKPEDRKFAISLFTLFMMFWAVLVIIGSFFRGPGFNFVMPWQAGIFFEL
jgi:menaquinol-cytochrome c reductase cytochrome b/c subunit